jgi:phosphoglycerate dehydrogenase-like enzyme
VVHEKALIEALGAGRLAGACLDCTEDEPLHDGSPLWTMENVILTPHAAGETSQFESRLIDRLLVNLRHLEEGLPLEAEAADHVREH